METSKRIALHETFDLLELLTIKQLVQLNPLLCQDWLKMNS